MFVPAYQSDVLTGCLQRVDQYRGHYDRAGIYTNVTESGVHQIAAIRTVLVITGKQSQTEHQAPQSKECSNHTLLFNKRIIFYQSDGKERI